MDITAELIGYLNSRPDVGARAYPEHPADDSAPLIVCARLSGGIPEPGVETARMRAWAYGGSREGSAATARDIVSALVEWRWDAPNIFNVSIDGQSDDIDPDNGACRSGVVATVTYCD